MTPSKLSKLRGELAAARRYPRTAREMESLAQRLGRKLANRGKEPCWISEVFPELRPVSSWGHRGDLRIGTQRNIVDQLEDDLLAWEEYLEGQEDEVEENE